MGSPAKLLKTQSTKETSPDGIKILAGIENGSPSEAEAAKKSKVIPCKLTPQANVSFILNDTGSTTIPRAAFSDPSMTQLLEEEPSFSSILYYRFQ